MFNERQRLYLTIILFHFIFHPGVPGRPSITLTTADVQATSLTVKWTAPADDGGSLITAYRVVITQGSTEKINENVTDPNTKELYIGNLNKDTNYAVNVYARNYVFEGDASQKIMKTKYEGEYPCKTPT